MLWHFADAANSVNLNPARIPLPGVPRGGLDVEKQRVKAAMTATTKAPIDHASKGGNSVHLLPRLMAFPA